MMVEFAVGRDSSMEVLGFGASYNSQNENRKATAEKGGSKSGGYKLLLKKSHKKLQLTIPRQTKASILLDNEVHTIGFPRLLYFSDGKRCKNKITYSEALFYKSSTSYSAHGGFKRE